MRVGVCVLCVFVCVCCLCVVVCRPETDTHNWRSQTQFPSLLLFRMVALGHALLALFFLSLTAVPGKTLSTDYPRSMSSGGYRSGPPLTTCIHTIARH